MKHVIAIAFATGLLATPAAAQVFENFDPTAIITPDEWHCRQGVIGGQSICSRRVSAQHKPNITDKKKKRD